MQPEQRETAMAHFVACVRRVHPYCNFEVFERALKGMGEGGTVTDWTSLTAYQKRDVLMDLPNQ